MSTVTVKQAQTHLSQLLKLVAKGESVTITNHGHPVASIVQAKQKATHPVSLFGCIDAPGLAERWDDHDDPVNEEYAALMLGEG